MWKRDQAPKSAAAPSAMPATPAAPVPQVAAISEATMPVASNEPLQHGRRSETRMVNIGQSVVIKGDLQGSEDLTIEGQVEGTIELNENVLTIGAHGRINARVSAMTVIILGTVRGNVSASDKVEIRDGASVDGDVVAPRVAIAEGAQFHGSVDMQHGAKRTQQANAAPMPVAKSALAAPVAAASTH